MFMFVKCRQRSGEVVAADERKTRNAVAAAAERVSNTVCTPLQAGRIQTFAEFQDEPTPPPVRIKLAHSDYYLTASDCKQAGRNRDCFFGPKNAMFAKSVSAERKTLFEVDVVDNEHFRLKSIFDDYLVVQNTGSVSFGPSEGEGKEDKSLLMLVPVHGAHGIHAKEVQIKSVSLDAFLRPAKNKGILGNYSVILQESAEPYDELRTRLLVERVCGENVED